MPGAASLHIYILKICGTVKIKAEKLKEERTEQNLQCAGDFS